MAQHRVCAECGATLDYGERCDCEREALRDKPARAMRKPIPDNTQSISDRELEQKRREREWLWC